MTTSFCEVYYIGEKLAVLFFISKKSKIKY